MKTKIDKTERGTISISNEEYYNDIIIRLNGDVDKRKKRLSKDVYGTSHIMSLEEARYIYDKGAEELIIGTGKDCKLVLSEEASEYFQRKNCKVSFYLTSEAIDLWNRAEGAKIGMFHISC